ncbi:MAG: efflux RND transporter periplasmic adaptor subunit, partial [bacterium]
MASPNTQDQDEKEGGNAGKRRWYKRKRVWFGVGVLAIVAVVVGGYWYLFLRGYVSTDDAYIHGNNVSVSAKMLGRIVDLTVDEGDSVTVGQVLVVLDSTDLKAQEMQAKAAIETAQKSADLAKVGVQRATDDFNRASVQYKGNVIPKEEFQHAQQALETAQAQLQLSLAQITSAQAQLGVVQSQLANTKIYAPFDGVVARRWAIVGDVVQPGQPVFAVYESSNVWVVANFEETKLTSIRVGDVAQLSVDAYPGKEFEGNLMFVGAAAAAEFSLIPPNNASGNFTKVTQRIPVRFSIREVDPSGSGHKRMFLIGLFLFTLGSFLSSLSPSLSVLIAFRVIQGFGAGTILPVGMAIITREFPPEKRGIALGFWAVAASASVSLGPTAGGYLIDHYSWHTIFDVNVPIGLMGMAVSSIVLREYRSEIRRGFDLIGFLSLALFLTTLLLALANGNSNWNTGGWTSKFIVTNFALSFIGLVVFLVAEFTVEHPLIELGLFRSHNFALSNIVLFIFGFGMFGSNFLLPIYL